MQSVCASESPCRGTCGNSPTIDDSDTLARIADAGVDHLFTADHISFFDGSGLDGLIHLAALSGLEGRLDLHLGVYLLALRHPMVAARQIASLAQAAPGRLTVGVGVGGEDRHEIEVCGVDHGRRGRRTDVALGLVRSLLDGDTVDGDGQFFDFTAGLIRPTPAPPRRRSSSAGGATPRCDAPAVWATVGSPPGVRRVDSRQRRRWPKRWVPIAR